MVGWRSTYKLCVYLFVAFFGIAFSALAQDDDTSKVDLPFPFEDKNYLPQSESRNGGIYLSEPSNFKSDIEYDPQTGYYNFSKKMGDKVDYRKPSYMTIEEYRDYDMKNSIRDYWSEKATAEAFAQGSSPAFRPSLNIKSEAFDKIFGGNTIDIRPQGSAELIFGVNSSKTENPAIPVKQQRITTFDFDEKIQLNVVGNIGTKMKLNMNYNTEAMFDFENVTKLGYTGNEDEIIQLIEAGNVTLPLKGSLITGSQSLFGIKTGLKFGKLTVTSVISQNKGQKQEIEVKGGAQIKEFEVSGDDYEANRHFFLSHFFRDNYERWVATPPILASEIFITKIEVYKTAINAFENTRNVIAFQDLGTADPDRLFNSGYVTDLAPGNNVPTNKGNDLYDRVSGNALVRGFLNSSDFLNAEGLRDRKDFQKISQAELLTEGQHYTVNKQLGYISLNSEVQIDQALAVAFQFTYRGRTYQVGEFSTDGVAGQDALVLKLLKSVEVNLYTPMWDLMMKNVYALGAYQVEKTGFELDVWYLDAATGIQINYLPRGSLKNKSIIQVLGLDKLSINNQAQPDGIFDFLDNPQITIIPRNGKIFFPLLEPFGNGLRDAFGTSELETANFYAFDSLYTNTKTNARVNNPNKNRFTIKGRYQSTVSSEIPLGALNVPEGSVVVTAGGAQLTENVDYTVDYTLGRVKIINQGVLESGTPIKVSLESNSLFAIQSKTMLASRFDYEFSKNLTFGGTIMNLTERPLTQKVNVGDEPINNTIYGVDVNYQTESELLTTILDKIPLISTKEKSTIQFSGEFAQLLPGHSRAIGKDGTSYIDDFEGSQSTIELRSFSTWRLASTPQGQPNLFPEGDLVSNLATGFNRAKLAWYVIDPTVFFRQSNITPDHIRNDDEMRSNHFMREVYETEVFPNRDFQVGQPTNIAMFDLAYYPEEKGPYNYDVDGNDSVGVKYAEGINDQGGLNAPDTRWGGIMRSIETNDWDAANIEFIQFWLMDPYAEAGEPGFPDQNVEGEIFFNIGNISEDILKDGQKFFENGLGTSEDIASDLSPDTVTPWGRSIPPSVPHIINAFDNDPQTRAFQDVGLEGLRDQEEEVFFEKQYLDKIAALYGTASGAYSQAIEDPSSDNYHYFRGDDYDTDELNVLERYKLFNGLEGNSPSSDVYESQNADGYPTTASTLPNAEDVNNDRNMNEGESYFQYRVKVSASDISPANVGSNFITDVLQGSATTPDQRTRTVNWYQFKIPVKGSNVERIGNPDIRSIRFMRIFVKGFNRPVFLRFARLELVRGEWRKYEGSCLQDGEYIPDDQFASFNIAAVNIEENSQKTPVNYVVPPDIQREINLGTTNLQRLNEQSLAMTICDLQDGCFQAAYRNMDLDVRMYNRLKMYVHGETSNPDQPVFDDELNVFVRLGTDFEDNYYEYEIPLKITPPGRYDDDSESDRAEVWIPDNNIDIEFAQLLNAKVARNAEVFDNNWDTRRPYVVQDPNYPKNTISVVGNPNLGTTKTVMIGVRNPRDNGITKCVEVWVNELRLSNFNDQSGWAAIGRLTSQLADLGTVSLSGSMSTPGFGSVEKKVQERQRETIQQVDASFSTDIGRFLPKATKLKIPMYVGYSKGVVKPQFDPLNPDIQLKPVLKDLKESGSDATFIDSIIDVTKSLTQRRSMNFTNVRKEKGEGSKKSHFYDLSNLSLTYAYSETYERDINIEHNTTRVYRGALNYTFSPGVKPFEPFKKVKFLKSKYLKLIRDINIYPGPKQIGFRTNVNRMYNQRLNRNTNPGIRAELPLFVNKTFDWQRQYDLKYDITKALKYDFNATNMALITERPGRVDRRIDKQQGNDDYRLWRDSLYKSLATFGQNTDYRHQNNLSWNLPLNKFPLTDWINATSRYSSSYNWTRAPFAADTLGHTIQNSNNIQLNGTANFRNLYNKVPYLKKVNQKFRRSRNKKKKPAVKKKTPDPPKNPNDSTDTKKKKREKDKNKITPIDHVVHVLMGVRNASLTYSQNNGLLLPGYGRRTQILGFDNQFEGPGVPFLLGMHEFVGDAKDRKFAEYAAERDWLVQGVNITTQHTNTHSENINFRSSIEPIKDLRIDLTANSTYSLSSSEFFTWNDSLDIPGYETQSFVETGSFSRSFSAWRTAFVSDNDDNSNEVFTKFLEYRNNTSARLAQNRQNSESSYLANDHENDQGFKEGYGGTAQDVLIPAFFAAYSGKPIEEQKLNLIRSLPDLNWRVTYTGLSKLPSLKKYFKTISINHSYKSTMSLSGFVSNVIFSEQEQRGDLDDNFKFVDTTDINANYIPEYQMNTATITEQFSPLINVDMTWKNSLQTRFEIKKDRNISLSMANTQITEVRGFEITVGAGYKIPKVKLNVRVGGQKKRLESDMNLRMDLSIRDNKTLIRKIVENTHQATAGQKTVSLKTTADYQVNTRLTVRFFYDFNSNRPFISTAFPTSNTNAGLSIRFTLAG
ncbi:MAG: cell surface protein SprA [Flavobacteriales bacterium]|nr:cell surface protein SprA [Flavobacteriales bacterium]